MEHVRKDRDQGYENLLLGALVLCCPTEEDKKFFWTSGLKKMLGEEDEDSETRTLVDELSKKFSG